MRFSILYTYILNTIHTHSVYRKNILHGLGWSSNSHSTLLLHLMAYAASQPSICRATLFSIFFSAYPKKPAANLGIGTRAALLSFLFAPSARFGYLFFMVMILDWYLE